MTHLQTYPVPKKDYLYIEDSSKHHKNKPVEGLSAEELNILKMFPSFDKDEKKKAAAATAAGVKTPENNNHQNATYGTTMNHHLPAEVYKRDDATNYYHLPI